jgi:AhpD family alkylhydroperoxidase
MGTDLINSFREYCEKMNQRLLAQDNRVIKRILNIDTNAHQDGALTARTKEMLGLVSSMVLRCDDCVRHHLGKCYEQEVTTEEIMEIFAVVNLVGGTVVKPHTRRALEYWEALEKNGG